MNLEKLFQNFIDWYNESDHNNVEKFYENKLTKENLLSKSKDEFINFFYNFVKDGGKIQSGGHRSVGKFKENLEANYEKYKEKLIEPFDDNFDVDEWLDWTSNFKYFGKGIATIYLNRIDNIKYVVVNNKSVEAYEMLGYDISTKDLKSMFLSLKIAQNDLLNKYPQYFKNLYQTDALSHFIVAVADEKLLREVGLFYKKLNHPILNILNEYKKIIQKTKLKDEIYKWELVNKYKGKPDLKANDFAEEIRSIDYGNLLYGLSGGIIKILAKENPNEIKQEFALLFDEKNNLNQRIKDFRNNTFKIYTSNEHKHSHHQDERAISTYLTFKDPIKYTFYKAKFYEKYCSMMNIEKAKTYEKYSHYLNLLDELIENYIKEDNELLELVQNLLPEHSKELNLKLLAQDILYQTLDKESEINYWVFQGNKFCTSSNNSLSSLI
jgi:hypothetical protein